VESPVPGNRHAGFGRRLGETHRWKHRQGAPGRPHWHVLEAVPEFELLLANAHAVKNMPGRKTDVADAQWLAELCECGLLRPSFVPAPVQG
jgi:transposase